MPKAVFRCDAGPGIGNGHVFRNLAIAAELKKRGWECLFAGNRAANVIMTSVVVEDERVPFLELDHPRDPEHFLAKLESLRDLVVFDHYGLDATYESVVRKRAGKILVLDDLANRDHDADLLLDQGVARVRDDYEGLISSQCRTLFGLNYVLIRPTVLTAREACLQLDRTAPVERLLVTVGGMDGREILPTLVAGILHLKCDLKIDVVLGSKAKTLEKIQNMSSANINVHVDTSKMPTLISAADFGIGVGGVSAFERCCCGVPSLLIEVADNQKQTCQALGQAGAAHFLGKWDQVSAGDLSSSLCEYVDNGLARKTMSDSAFQLIDGFGAQRVVDEIFSF